MEFTSGKNSVTFKSQGVILAGHLHLPEGFDASEKYPSIVFSGPFNQVKEQMELSMVKNLRLKAMSF